MKDEPEEQEVTEDNEPPYFGPGPVIGSWMMGHE